MSQIVYWQHILDIMSLHLSSAQNLDAKNTQNDREYRVAHTTVYLNEAATGHSYFGEKGALTSLWLGA